MIEEGTTAAFGEPGVADGLAPKLEFGDAGSAAGKSGFDDRKSPGAFRTIGEVARALGIRQHVLRYWEEQFPMLTPVKRSGNRRYYRREDVELIETIDRLVHHQGYTLRGARLALEAKMAVRSDVPAVSVSLGDAVPAAVPAATPPRIEAWRAELLAIRADLAAALAA